MLLVRAFLENEWQHDTFVNCFFFKERFLISTTNPIFFQLSILSELKQYSFFQICSQKGTAIFNENHESWSFNRKAHLRSSLEWS